MGESTTVFDRYMVKSTDYSISISLLVKSVRHVGHNPAERSTDKELKLSEGSRESQV